MKNLVYHGFLFVFIVITAFIDIGNKIIMRWLSPIEAAALVAGFGAFFALGSSLLRVYVFKTKKKMSFDRATYTKLLLLGIGAGSALIISNTAIDIVGPLTFRILQIVCFPVFVALLSYFVEGIVVSGKDIISTLIAIGGFLVYFVDELGNLNFIYLGIITSILAALIYALVLFLTKHLAAYNVSNELLITYRFGLLGISSLFFVDVLPGDVPLRIVFLILGLGLMGYWFRYELMIEGIRYLPATTLSIYSVTTPVFTAIFNRLFIMDEPYHVAQIAGMALIVLSLLYAVYERPPRGSVVV